MADPWSHFEKDLWMIQETTFGTTPDNSGSWWKPGAAMKLTLPVDVHIDEVKGPGSRLPYGSRKGGPELKLTLEFDAWGDDGWKSLLRGAMGSNTGPGDDLPSFSLVKKLKRSGDTDYMMLLFSGCKVDNLKLSCDYDGLAPLHVECELLAQMYQTNEYAIENALDAYKLVGFQGTAGNPLDIFNAGAEPTDPTTDPLMWHRNTAKTMNIGGGGAADIEGLLSWGLSVSNNLVPQSGVLTGADGNSYYTRHAALHEGDQSIVFEMMQLEPYEDPDTVTSSVLNQYWKAYEQDTVLTAVVLTILDSGDASRTITLSNGHFHQPPQVEVLPEGGPAVQGMSAFFEGATLALS